MKRSADDNTIARVYAYGAGDPSQDVYVQAEAERCNALWNRLIEIDKEADGREIEASQQDPAMAAARADLEAANEALTKLIDARRAERAKARAKVPTPELDAQIKEAAKVRNAASKMRWAKLRRWRKDNPETVAAIRDWRKAAVVEARKNSGCWWPNYNAVLDDYATARGRALKTGARIHPREGTAGGRLTVQIQRTRSGLGAAPRELMDGTYNPMQIGMTRPEAHDLDTPRGERRRLSRTEMDMRIDAAGHRIRVPLVLHRPLPEGCRIKAVQLAWGPEGERTTARLCLTAKLPAPTYTHPSRAAVAIDVGWRLEDDGRLLVATLLDSAGQIDRLHLPARWMIGMDQVERLGGYVDDGLLEVAEAIQATTGLPESITAAAANWRRGLGARHVDATALHDAVRAHRDDNLPTWLTDWYTRYRHLDLWRHNLRTKLLRQRRELYRVFAHRLVAHYGLVAMETLDLAAMALNKRHPDGDDPTLHAAARAQRVRAACHELRENITHQAAKARAELVLIDGPSTLRCHHCGGETEQRNRAARKWECTHCHARWDQDINAAHNILAAATGGASGRVVAISRDGESTSYERPTAKKADRSQTAPSAP